MPKEISRRAFLKGGVAAACTMAAAGAPTRALASDGSRHLATLLDIRKCIGCESCVEACREANGAKYPKPKKPFPP